MKEKYCPYCHNTVDENENICHICNRELTIQCPYCKQTIKAYDAVCPYCTTKLNKSFNPMILIVLGAVLSIIWLVINLILITFLNFHPTLLLAKNKHGELLLSLSDYVNLVFGSMVIAIVPYIISLVNKYKTKITATALIFNVICAFVLMGYFIYLYNIAK